MTSNSSKALPFVAAFIVIASLAVEAFYNVTVDLETAMPFLVAIGLGGAGLKAIQRAAEARKNLSPEIETLIKSEISKLKPS